MNKLTSFQCTICQDVGTDFSSSMLHESNCIKRKQDKNESKIYLDSFRERVSSLKELFILIDSEMSSILDAINILKFYDNHKNIRSLKNLKFKKIGSSISNRSYLKRPVDSAPVGINKVSLWSHEETDINYRAYNIQISFDIFEEENSVSILYLLDFIGGINILTGGGCVENSCNSLYFDAIIWLDDYPNGLSDLN